MADAAAIAAAVAAAMHAAHPPPPDGIPRIVSDLDGISKCADSGRDDIMDKSKINVLAYISLRMCVYFELNDRGNIFKTLQGDLHGTVGHADRVQVRHKSGAVLDGTEIFNVPDAKRSPRGQWSLASYWGIKGLHSQDAPPLGVRK